VAHASNDLFAGVWRNSVYLLVLWFKKFHLNPQLQTSKFDIAKCAVHFLQSQVRKSCTLNRKHWGCKYNDSQFHQKLRHFPIFVDPRDKASDFKVGMQLGLAKAHHKITVYIQVYSDTHVENSKIRTVNLVADHVEIVTMCTTTKFTF